MAEKQYIEREAALDCFACDLGKKDYSVSYQGFMTESAFRINAVPAADVAPVVHGRWILDGDYEYINCSECLYPFYMGFDTSSDARQYLAREERWKYCPNCGAKMDGDGE